MTDLARPTPKISVESATEADLKELMMGTNGNPSYEEQWGITAAAPGELPFQQKSLAELELEAEQAHARALDPNAHGRPALNLPTDDEDTDLAKFKKLYGDSENEKGELRRQNAELAEALDALANQIDSLTQQPPNPYGAQGPQQPYPQYPQYGTPPTYPYNTQPQYNTGRNRLDEIKDEDYINGQQLKELIAENIAPAFQVAWQEAQQAKAMAAQMARAAAEAQRASSGLTKTDEILLMGKNKWLRALPEAQRLEAMKALKAQQASGTNGKPATSSDKTERIVNKLTYIEGGTPQTVESSQAALESAFNRDVAKAMSLPAETGARARALREISKKYNMDFAKPPSDLTR